MRFLAIGECMAEFAPSSLPGDYRLGFAGDTYNTAWYLARLRPGRSVSYFTAIGPDPISQMMREALAANGIDTTWIRTVPDRTVGLYLISLKDGERSFAYWRGQSAARLLADDAKAIAKAVSDAELVYFSGITLAILEPPGREVLLNVLRHARSVGKSVAFDPNLRPQLWADTAEMVRFVALGAAVSNIVLPSFADEARWFADANPAATAHRYAAAGASTVVVKNGAAPVYYRQGNISGTMPVPSVTSVVDTTAAGDSFNAAILDGIRENAPLKASIDRACRLAAQVVAGKGALVTFDMDD
ncbi:hypothetical protein Q669_27855 [Labrenzia sp. C1B10]|uniref:sugar kinase n=1 Tax=unclassified Labrenzia TaxID=2648686 RepID=UPI0003B8101D|nr:MULTISPECIES: sugar kinase [unclassified Labrenzia]ERP96675.1 hypothetical protein Q669_27855 [Labrenzia sp. C1B10]ERS03532.1 hypothetical protein Q675_31160 [Labrenzia sp. C1B70]